MSTIPELTKHARELMHKAVESTKREFSTIRSNKASPSLLDLTAMIRATETTMSSTSQWMHSGVITSRINISASFVLQRGRLAAQRPSARQTAPGKPCVFTVMETTRRADHCSGASYVGLVRLAFETDRMRTSTRCFAPAAGNSTRFRAIGRPSRLSSTGPVPSRSGSSM
jgi:hypothetical protein